MGRVLHAKLASELHNAERGKGNTSNSMTFISRKRAQLEAAGVRKSETEAAARREDSFKVLYKRNATSRLAQSIPLKTFMHFEHHLTFGFVLGRLPITRRTLQASHARRNRALSPKGRHVRQCMK